MIKAQIIATDYHLPAATLSNEALASRFPEWTAKKIEEKLGIVSRPIAAVDECSSDLAAAAAQKLFASGACSPGDIDYLIFCTQSPDYFLPTTACLLQERLNLPKSAGAIDFNLGCSGYIYGLGLAKGLIETGQAKTLLFLTGETYSKFLSPEDKSTLTLFGDAGSATLISGIESTHDLIGPFVYGTDGKGGKDLIVPQGGMRQPGAPREDASGLCMNGGEIFDFSVREIQPAINTLLSKSGITIDAVDLFVFHQANRYMLDFLRKKCRIPEEKFYTWYSSTGNTVSNTIPIALHHAIAEGCLTNGMTAMFVGFGVGLSWGSCLARF